MEQIGFKTLGFNGKPIFGGQGEWSLPTKKNGKWIPGEWMERLPVELCNSGYHLTKDLYDLLNFLGPKIYIAEYRGKMSYNGYKMAVAEARLLRPLKWNKRQARLFLCDCTELGLKASDIVSQGDISKFIDVDNVITSMRNFCYGELDYSSFVCEIDGLTLKHYKKDNQMFVMEPGRNYVGICEIIRLFAQEMKRMDWLPEYNAREGRSIVLSSTVQIFKTYIYNFIEASVSHAFANLMKYGHAYLLGKRLELYSLDEKKYGKLHEWNILKPCDIYQIIEDEDFQWGER